MSRLAAVRTDDDNISHVSLRPRIDVLAVDAADVVDSAGGWLFERAWAGWQVTVFLAELADARPLDIIGAETLPLERVLAGPQVEHETHLLAAAGALIGSEQRARARMVQALQEGEGRGIVWGDNWPISLDRRIESVEHQLSPAAFAFKAHALRAAAAFGQPVSRTETFHCRMKMSGATNWDLSRIG